MPYNFFTSGASSAIFPENLSKGINCLFALQACLQTTGRNIIFLLSKNQIENEASGLTHS